MFLLINKQQNIAAWWKNLSYSKMSIPRCFLQSICETAEVKSIAIMFQWLFCTLWTELLVSVYINLVNSHSDSSFLNHFKNRFHVRPATRLKQEKFDETLKGRRKLWWWFLTLWQVNNMQNNQRVTKCISFSSDFSVNRMISHENNSAKYISLSFVSRCLLLFTHCSYSNLLFIKNNFQGSNSRWKIK